FFLQAEDGIRDKLVTGVQTCALPISQYGRFVTIQDAPYYRVVYSSPDVLHEDTGVRSQYITWFTLDRIVNHFIEQNGQRIHEVGPYFGFSYRGTLTPAHVDLVNSNVIGSSACMNAVRSVPRPMTEVAGTIAGSE